MMPCQSHRFALIETGLDTVGGIATEPERTPKRWSDAAALTRLRGVGGSFAMAPQKSAICGVSVAAHSGMALRMR